MFKLLKFGTSTCNNCKFVDIVVKKIRSERPDLEFEFESHDAISESTLGKSYGIEKVVPFVVLLKDGVPVYTKSGIPLKDTLISFMS